MYQKKKDIVNQFAFRKTSVKCDYSSDDISLNFFYSSFLVQVRIQCWHYVTQVRDNKKQYCIRLIDYYSKASFALNVKRSVI